MSPDRLRRLIAHAESNGFARPLPFAAAPSRALTSATAPTTFLDWETEAHLADNGFDAVYPLEIRALSSTFWTPVRVAIQAAKLLVRDSSTRVLDFRVRSGKFCIVGAAATGASFVGVEQREHLVEASRAAALSLGVTNARFVHARFDTVDIAFFDAVYLYNPFEENVWCRRDCIDESVELSRERFVDDVGRAERLLARARPGTRVVTYHGFGGLMPPTYRLARTAPCHTGQLMLWIQGEGGAPRYCASERPGDTVGGACGLANQPDGPG